MINICYIFKNNAAAHRHKNNSINSPILKKNNNLKVILKNKCVLSNFLTNYLCLKLLIVLTF